MLHLVLERLSIFSHIGPYFTNTKNNSAYLMNVDIFRDVLILFTDGQWFGIETILVVIINSLNDKD